MNGKSQRQTILSADLWRTKLALYHEIRVLEGQNCRIIITVQKEAAFLLRKEESN